MIEIVPNAFTIANGCPRNQSTIPIKPGIDVVRDGHGCPRLAFGARTVNLGTCQQDMPIISQDGKRLVRAQIKVGSANTPPTLVYALQKFDGILVRIEALELNFGYSPLARGLNLWPGGDGDILPIITSYGENAKTHRVQLFQLFNRQSLFVVDRCGAVTKMTCVNGAPAFTHVDLPVLVEFHVRRAQKQASVKSYDWALHNLRRISSARSLLLVANAIHVLESAKATLL